VDVVSGERILGLIPARGGSKRVPRKNLAPLGGKPLIAHAIENARGSGRLSRTILSTDDEEIREIAGRFGADVPFLRPAELSGDDSPTIDVVLHALGVVEDAEEKRYDYVCVLEPTAPFRTARDIDSALSLLLSEGTDSVIGLSPVGYTNPARLRVMRDNRVHLWAPELWQEGRRTQDLDRTYAPAGGLFACRRDVVVGGRTLHGRSQCGYIFPPERALDIDTPFDLAFAEFLMARAGGH
jgi:CMP-N-acetylneuraminic acid synthetase